MEIWVGDRELNRNTVKDKFPNPIIEGLLDELARSQFYSKIDLRAGYHHVRMDTTDVYKTAFKTHSAHFVFLVMPFGLPNALVTFQSLMNEVFRAYLRKFVLVFFDDILINIANMSDHVKHLETVLHLMRQHELYGKLSKCSFGITKVEYLGYYISGQ